jgi:sterol 3beta-glucosyltransferase
LVDWLDAGPPPVFLGFGSMPILDPAPVLEMAIEAARRARVRVLIGAGWTEFAGAAGGLPEYVQITDAIDHDWLFPRCQAVVHHGGTGTTGAGLTAGRPTWIFSMFMDQPYWGSRVERLGVGGYDRFTRLSVRTLSTALEVLSREDVRRRADALGRRLRAEDGVANAVRAITGAAVTGIRTR